MKYSSLVALLILWVVVPAHARETRVYEHPSLDFRFSAPEGMQPVAHPDDDLSFEVVDPKTGIHVLLWYTTTEQGARDYLKKMAGMKDLVIDQEPRATNIDQRDAWVLRQPDKIVGESIHAVLAVIAGGKSRVRPKENALYIVEILCPAERYMENWRTMEDILFSVKIMANSTVAEGSFPLYPETLDDRPDLPSPFTTRDGAEYVVARTKAGAFVIVPATVENGTPNNYPEGQWGKGRQLQAGSAEFPTLGRTGLHADAELARATTITGRPVSDITAEARPGNASGVGFLAEDEEILSVIRGDNRRVASLGLTHPQLARPLFMVFNVVLRNLEAHRRDDKIPANDIEYLLWDGHPVFIDSYGSKGWQESLFDDEVLGYFELRMSRELAPEEDAYLREHYASLTAAELAELKEKLTVIHTGEMVPFYVMRYGFYEGHTGYRADPVAIASIFGLMSIPEIDDAVGGALYRVLTAHYEAETPAPYRSNDQSKPSSTRL